MGAWPWGLGQITTIVMPICELPMWCHCERGRGPRGYHCCIACIAMVASDNASCHLGPGPGRQYDKCSNASYIFQRSQAPGNQTQHKELRRKNQNRQRETAANAAAACNTNYDTELKNTTKGPKKSKSSMTQNRRTLQKVLRHPASAMISHLISRRLLATLP